MVVARCHVIRLNTFVDAGGQRVSEIVTERGGTRISRCESDHRARHGREHAARAVSPLAATEGSAGICSRICARTWTSAYRARHCRLCRQRRKRLKRRRCSSKGNISSRNRTGLPDGVGHFHFQITASGLGASGTDSEAELFKKIPDIDTFDAHKNATDTHVVITVRGIGEMEPKQDDDFGNSVTLDLDSQQNDEFQTRRAFVNLQPSARDMEFWNAMDKASDDVAKIFANGQNIDVIKNGQVIATERRCESALDDSALQTLVTRAVLAAATASAPLITKRARCGWAMTPINR